MQFPNGELKKIGPNGRPIRTDGSKAPSAPKRYFRKEGGVSPSYQPPKGFVRTPNLT